MRVGTEPRKRSPRVLLPRHPAPPRRVLVDGRRSPAGREGRRSGGDGCGGCGFRYPLRQPPGGNAAHEGDMVDGWHLSDAVLRDLDARGRFRPVPVDPEDGCAGGSDNDIAGPTGRASAGRPAGSRPADHDPGSCSSSRGAAGTVGRYRSGRNASGRVVKHAARLRFRCGTSGILLGFESGLLGTDIAPSEPLDNPVLARTFSLAARIGSLIAKSSREGFRWL